MGPYARQVQELAAELKRLMVEGTVAAKRAQGAGEKSAQQKFLLIRYSNRELEIEVTDEEFEQTEPGAQFRFVPPVPGPPLCGRVILTVTIVGLAVGLAGIWAIAGRFSERTAAILSFMTAGWIALLVWVFVCSYQHRRYIEELRREIAFFSDMKTGRAHPK